MDSRCMDLSLKPCIKLGKKQHQRDRLSNLPIELLIYILSLTPTKSAVVVCALLKINVLPWITGLDFDILPISHCLSRLNKVERFPYFQTFVDSILQAHQSPSLTRFRLNLGEHLNSCLRGNRSFEYGCSQSCLLDLKSTQINEWISFPLTRCGLRELDLCIYLRGPPDHQTQLPPEIFMKETLEVLKLDVNLSFDGISNFRLPNFKTLHINASFISEDAFLTSLVSSCPLLEELDMSAWWDHVHFTNISSPSLRRLTLSMLKLEDEDNTDLVVLDTPNLEYLTYYDNVALQYSITSMSRLDEARIDFEHPLFRESEEVSCQNFLTLIRTLSNVRRLALTGMCPSILSFIKKKKQLPVFHNLIRLELEMFHDVQIKLLMTFLYRSPNLETLVLIVIGLVADDYDEHRKLESEQELRRLSLATIPWCCRFNLKKIVIEGSSGSEVELVYLQFLLKHSLVLEELIVITHDPTMLESTFKNLPRASHSCSIQLQLRHSPV